MCMRDPNVDLEDTSDPEDKPEDTDEDTLMWMRLGRQPDRGQIGLVRSNWRRIEGQIDVIWQNLRQVIVDASQEHGRISREEHYLKVEVKMLTLMSLLMLRRAELLQSFDTEVDLSVEF